MCGDSNVRSETAGKRPSELRPAWISDEEYPFESRYLRINNCRVHYIDEGAGPSILMLSGNPFWSFVYRRIVSGLRETFRCIAPDYPGFGLSVASLGYDFRPATHARVIEEFVERLSLSGWTLMANDWGGPIGLWIAGRHPDQVRSLVLGNTWAWPAGDRDRSLRMFSAVVGGPLGDLLVKRLNIFLNVFVARGMGGRRPSARALRAYKGPFPTSVSRQPIRVFPREIRASAAWLREVELGLSAIRDKPALLTWAAKDPAFGEYARTRFEDLFPRHETVTLREAGHNIQDDASDQIVAAVRAWWRTDATEHVASGMRHDK
jgi:haloalkane dehalogenase